jgi:hypothetical protein
MPLFEMGKAKLKNCLGIYITIESISVVEVRLEGDAVKVDRYVKIPLPEPKKEGESARAAAMNADFFTTETNWLPYLDKAMKQIKWETNKVVITLSPQFAVFRHFLMPAIERRFWKQSIPIEAKKYVPFPFETSTYDFQVYQYENPDVKNKIGVLFSLTNTKISEAITAGVTKIGLVPQSIEVSANSIDRVLGHVTGGRSGAKIYTHFDTSTAYMLLSNNGVPLLFREVNFGDAQSTERRRLDAKGSIEFVNKQLGTQQIFKEIFLSGENLDLWRVVLEDDAKLPTKQWDPKQILKLKEGDWGIYASIGAALRAIQGDGGIDLLNRIKESAEDKRAIATAWVLAITIASLTGLMALTAQVRRFIASSDLNKIKAQSPDVPEFKGKSPSDIEDLVNQVKGDVSHLQTAMGKRDYVTPKMVALSETVPDKVWITNFSYRSNITFDANSPSESKMDFNGFIRTGDPKADLAIFSDFKTAFRAHPAINSAYVLTGKVDGTFTAAPIKVEAGGGLGDASFNMSCVSRQGS